MKIYELYPIGQLDHAWPVDDDDWDIFNNFDGTPHATDWTPVPFRIVSEDFDTGEPLGHSDFPWMTSRTLMLRDAAWDRAAPILQPYGEILPLACDTAKLAAFNPTQILDVLDNENTDAERFDDGDIMFVKQYAFHGKAIPERAVFKIPDEPVGSVLYTGAIVDDLNALGLAGLDWRVVWESGAS